MWSRLLMGCREAAVFGFFLLGLLLLVQAAFTAAGIYKLRQWEAVPCTVAKAELLVDPADEGYPAGGIEYDYITNDRGPAVGWVSLSSPSINETEELLAALRANPRQECFVNPENQWESKLARPGFLAPVVLGLAAAALLAAIVPVAPGPRQRRRLRFFAAAVFGAFVAAAVYCFLSEQKSMLDKPAFGGPAILCITGAGLAAIAWPDGPGARRRLPRFVAVVLSTTFVTAGIYWLWPLFTDDSAERAARVVSVPCTDLSGAAAFTKKKDQGAEDIRARGVMYRYEWQGRTWHSSWVNFAKDNRFPEAGGVTGPRARCWVDPQEPWVAVLDKTPNRTWPGALAGMGCLFIGTGGFYWLCRRKAKPGPPEMTEEEASPALPAA